MSLSFLWLTVIRTPPELFRTTTRGVQYGDPVPPKAALRASIMPSDSSAPNPPPTHSKLAPHPNNQPTNDSDNSPARSSQRRWPRGQADQPINQPSTLRFRTCWKRLVEIGAEGAAAGTWAVFRCTTVVRRAAAGRAAVGRARIRCVVRQSRV